MSAPVANPLASFPVGSLNSQYRMGPLLAETLGVDFWWNRQLEDGSYTLCEVHGWKALEYITPVDQVGGRDGGLVGPQSVGPRILEMSGMIVSPSAQLLHQNIEKIRTILGPQTLGGARQPVVWEQYEFGHAQRLALVTRPFGKFDPVIVEGYEEGGQCAVIDFSLVAANPPWKYLAGQVESAEVGLVDPGLVDGFTFDLTFDFTFGTATNPGGELQAVNQGNLTAHPVFIVTGPANIPVITNATTGEEFSINADIQAGETVRIDARTGVVTPASVRLLGRPFALQPGANTIRWRTTDDVYDPDALLRLEWRSTYS